MNQSCLLGTHLIVQFIYNMWSFTERHASCLYRIVNVFTTGNIATATGGVTTNTLKMRGPTLWKWGVERTMALKVTNPPRRMEFSIIWSQVFVSVTIINNNLISWQTHRQGQLALQIAAQCSEVRELVAGTVSYVRRANLLNNYRLLIDWIDTNRLYVVS